MIKKISSIFRSFDYLGSSVTLTVKGSGAVKTVFGAALSLLGVLAIAVGVGVLLDLYLDKSKPNVVHYLTERDEYPRIDLFREAVVPPVALVDVITTAGVPREQVSRFGFFVAVMYHFKVLQTASGSQLVQTLEQMPMVPCDQLSPEVDDALYGAWNKSPNSRYLKQTFSFCVDPKPEAFDIVGKPNDADFRWFTVMFLPCTLASGCATEEELSRIYVNVPEMKKTVSPADHRYPLKTLPVLEDIFPLSGRVTLRVQNRLKMNRVVDSSGFLSPEIERVHFADIGKVLVTQAGRDSSVAGCDLSRLLLRECQPYALFVYMSSGAETTYQRSYLGLFETLGNIGGLKELVLIALGCLYCCFHSSAEKRFLARHVYSPEESLKALERQLAVKLSPAAKQRLHSKLLATAEAAVRESLDVVALVRSCNLLHFVVEALLTPQMKKLVPLNHLLKSKIELDRKKNKRKNRTVPLNSPEAVRDRQTPENQKDTQSIAGLKLSKPAESFVESKADYPSPPILVTYSSPDKSELKNNPRSPGNPPEGPVLCQELQVQLEESFNSLLCQRLQECKDLWDEDAQAGDQPAEKAPASRTAGVFEQQSERATFKQLQAKQSSQGSALLGLRGQMGVSARPNTLRQGQVRKYFVQI